jgi:uncharacterized protein (TIGR02391 family)
VPATDVGAAASATAALARQLASEVAEFAQRRIEPTTEHVPEPLAPAEEPLGEYDRRIMDDDLRTATRSRFVSRHYADAVEAGVKALNECVRARTGSGLDGDGLMTWAFSVNDPKLRVPARMRSDSDRSEQRGHMMMCQGVVAAWRNPRAHSSNIDDQPDRALMMLETVQHLIAVTKAATRTRAKKSK